METYKLRLKFYIANKGMIAGKEKEYEFVTPNGKKAIFTCDDAERFEEGTRFVILSGGYESENEAFDVAKNLKESVLCFGAKFGMGIDIGKNVASGSLSNNVKDNICKDTDVRMVDDVHGISVYCEEFPTSSMSFSAEVLFNSRDRTFFIEEVCNIMSAPRQLDDKVKLSMELLSASYFESSSRSRFLTLILAAESLLKPDDRSKDVKKLVDNLKALTKETDLAGQEKSSILGSLSWLYKDSVSLSLRKMAKKYLNENFYDDVSSDVFIKKCYDARSKLIHSGGVDESIYNIGTLAANLEVYMKDMLVEISEI